MYVNPFERMRKKREEADKLQEEADKEREKYARLGAQMGLTQEKGVMPSFIKSLIGDNNQTKVPPFGMGVGSSDSGSGPFAGMAGEPFVNDSVESPQVSSYDSSLNASFPNNQTSGQKYETAPMQNQIPVPPSFEETPMNIAQMNEALPQQQPMFENNSIPSFGIPIDSTSLPSFEQSVNPSFDNNHVPVQEYETPSMLNQIPVPPSFGQKPMNESPISGQEPTIQVDQQLNVKTNRIAISTFTSMLNQNTVEGKLFVLMAANNNLQAMSDSFINELLPEQRNILDAEEIHLYGSPFLFLLKQIVNILPFVSIEDKRVLWDKTSLLLAATEYGKTGSEVDDILEDFAIENPIERIQEEFLQVLEAYDLNLKPLLIILRGFNNLELIQTTKTLHFIDELFNQLINFKFIFEFSESFIIEAQSTDAGSGMLQKVQGYIVDGQELSESSNSNFEPLTTPTLQSNSFEPQVFGNTNQSVTPNIPIPEIGIGIDNTAFHSEPIVNQTTNQQSFENSLPTVNNDLPPGMNFGFPSSLEIEEEEPEEEYVSGLDNNVRIRVDLNLQKKQAEQDERDKKEELERLERMGGHGFNPAILADSKTNNMFIQPKRVQETLNVNRATILEHKKVQDPRDFDTIKGKLNELTKDHESKVNINIQDSFTTKTTENKNLIDVPGNWMNINNK